MVAAPAVLPPRRRAAASSASGTRVREAELGGDLVVDAYGVERARRLPVAPRRRHHGAGRVRPGRRRALARRRLRASRRRPRSAPSSPTSCGATSPPDAADRRARRRPSTLLAWRYTRRPAAHGRPGVAGRRRRGAALGVGRLDRRRAGRRGPATPRRAARRGPWTLDELTIADGAVTGPADRPGGPIAGVAVTFTADTGGDGGGRHRSRRPGSTVRRDGPIAGGDRAGRVAGTDRASWRRVRSGSPRPDRRSSSTVD